MIAAGFLHDMVEDTEVTAEEIEANFGARGPASGRRRHQTF